MILTIDIETLPASDQRTIDRIGARIKPPGTLKKQESINKWLAEDKAAAIDEAVSRSGLNGLYGSAYCIGVKRDDEPAKVFCNDREGDTLLQLTEWFDFIPSHERHPLTVVGHNVINFDLRFLKQRFMINGVKPPALPWDAKPWDSGVFDTMTQWAGVRDFVSLDDLCFAFGIEGKGDMDGSKVAQYIKEGRGKEVQEYCAQDVEKTYKVFQRMTFKGKP